MNIKVSSKYAQIFAVIIFLVILPSKYVALALFGVNTTGNVVELSTKCEKSVPLGSKPRVAVLSSVSGVSRNLSGWAGYGNPEFCNIHIGDDVLVSYFEIPITHVLVASLGRPWEIAKEFLVGGLFLNIALAVALYLTRRSAK